jgi:hypothetical protein
MRHSINKAGFLASALVLTVCFGLAAVPALAQTTTTKQPMKCAESVQGQQLCPPASAPAKTLCSVSIDCPPIQDSGQTLCQPGVDCPSGKPAAKPDKKKK